MKTKIFDFFTTLITAFIFFVLTGILIRYESLQYDNIVSFIVFALVIFVHIRLLKGKRSGQVLFFYICNFILLNVIIRFIEGWKNGLLAVPNLFFIVAGMVSGNLLFAVKTSKKFIVPSVLFVLALCQAFIFHPYWVNYVNFKNFTGKTSEHKSGYDWKFYNNNGDTLSKADYKDKIVLLDFWNTSCGVCFTKFPILEKLYSKYKDNPKVNVQAINIPIERDTGTLAFTLIKKKNYTFPVLIGVNNADSVFGIESYPTTLVLYNDEIVYRGYIENSETTVDELLSEK